MAGKEVILKDVRTSFLNVFQTDKFGKYSVSLLIEKNSANHKALLAAEEAVAKEQWKDKADNVLKTLRNKDEAAVHDGDNKAEYDGFEGMVYIHPSNAKRPTLIDRKRNPVTEGDGVLYSGCYVNAIVEVWPQDSKEWGKRVNTSLKGLQFFRDGDPFAGGAKAAAVDDFEDLGDGADDDLD
jgi:hypothetical protein